MNIRSTEADEFWQWLVAKARSLQNKYGMSETLTNELSGKFDKAFPGLTWEIERHGNEWWFVISADGLRDLIDDVIDAYRSAPKIPYWRIVPFRQRGKMSVSIKFENRELGYDDIWCRAAPNGSRVDIEFCIAGLNEETEQVLKGATFILLDNAIGEFDSMVRIGGIEFRALEGTPVRSDHYFSLGELPGYLDNLPR